MSESEMESTEADWMPGYSNGFLLAFAMSIANEEELAEICNALDQEMTTDVAD